jgi:putative methionine-R-sulfoxide reductase with GAF domain/Tol biopolymer transport system component
MRRAAKIPCPAPDLPDGGNRKTCRTRHTFIDAAEVRRKQAELSELETLSIREDEPVSYTLSRVVEAVRVITAADGAAIAVRDQMGLVCEASSGSAPEVGSRLQPDSGLTRECFEIGQAVICEDAEHDARVGRSIARSLHLGSAVIVPIRDNGHVAGVLEVLSSRPNTFDVDDIAELERIAHALSSVIPGIPEPPPAEPQRQLFLEKPPEPREKTKRVWPSLALAAAMLVLAALLYAGLHYRPAHVSVTARSAPSTVANPIMQLPVPESAEAARPKISPPSAPAVNAQQEQSTQTDQVRPSEPRVPPPALEPSHAGGLPLSAVPAPEVNRGGPESATQIALAPVAPSLVVSPATVPALNPPAMIVPSARAIRVPDFFLHRNVKAHSGWVTTVAFTADGQRLASGSADESMKFWDVTTGQELNAVNGDKQVQAIAFSRDGRWLASEDSTHSVALFDARTGREVRRLIGKKPTAFLGSKNWVYSIAFRPDGRRLATALDNKTVTLWDVDTGEAIRDFTASPRSIMYIAFSPDGRWLASGGDDKTIKIWDVNTGEVIQTLSGHKKTVYAVAFSPDGRRLASASGDKTVRVWDVTTGSELQTLIGHRNLVTSLAFSPDGRWLASGSWDDTVKIWDVDSGREIKSLTGHSHPVYSIAFDARGQWLASGSEDGTIKLWQLR